MQRRGINQQASFFGRWEIAERRTSLYREKGQRLPTTIVLFMAFFLFLSGSEAVRRVEGNLGEETKYAISESPFRPDKVFD